MTPEIITREEVAAHLGIPARVLVRYEARGLVRARRVGEAEGYAPADVRRLWTILTFQRDLGINLAGVEVILRLRDQMADLHRRLDRLAVEFRRALEDEDPADADG